MINSASCSGCLPLSVMYFAQNAAHSPTARWNSGVPCVKAAIFEPTAENTR